MGQARNETEKRKKEKKKRKEKKKKKIRGEEKGKRQTTTGPQIFQFGCGCTPIGKGGAGEMRVMPCRTFPFLVPMWTSASATWEGGELYVSTACPGGLPFHVPPRQYASGCLAGGRDLPRRS